MFEFSCLFIYFVFSNYFSFNDLTVVMKLNIFPELYDYCEFMILLLNEIFEGKTVSCLPQ